MLAMYSLWLIPENSLTGPAPQMPKIRAKFRYLWCWLCFFKIPKGGAFEPPSCHINLETTYIVEDSWANICIYKSPTIPFINLPFPLCQIKTYSIVVMLPLLSPPYLSPPCCSSEFAQKPETITSNAPMWWFWHRKQKIWLKMR